jgi:hypothetical protein
MGIPSFVANFVIFFQRVEATVFWHVTTTLPPVKILPPRATNKKKLRIKTAKNSYPEKRIVVKNRNMQ